MNENDLFALIMGGAFIAFFIIFAICFVILIVMSIVDGYPLYKMAKKAGLDYPLLAYIPVGSTWTLIMLARKPFDMFNGKFVMTRDKAALIAILLSVLPRQLSIVSSTGSSIPILGILIVLGILVLTFAVFAVNMIFRYYIIDDFFSTYTPYDTNKTLYVVLSLLIPLFFLVMRYIHMNDEPDYSYVEYYKAVDARENRKNNV